MRFGSYGEEGVFGAEAGSEEWMCVVVDDGGCADCIDQVIY